MNDLFEKEEQVLSHAKIISENFETEAPEAVQKEYIFLMGEYAQLLRQLRWVTRISDLTAIGLNTDRETLLNKVNIDALTEIYNRRFLMTNLERCLEISQSVGEWVTVMMLDVDFFKSYNDTYGHTRGDACLRKIAETLHNSLSGVEDFVVRYGGEEFIAVLPGASRETGMMVAQRIQDNIQALEMPHEKSLVAEHVTLSIGFVSAIPKRSSNLQLYIDQADSALYLSKENGRNRITCLEIGEDKL